MRLPRLLALFATLLLAVGVVAGCSDDDDSSSSSSSESADDSTSSSGDLCDAGQDLETALQELVQPSTLSGGSEGIESALDDVQSALGEVGDATSAAVSDDVDQMTSDLDSLKTTVGDLGDGTTITDVSEGVNALVDDFDALQQSLADASDCDLSTVSTASS